MKHHENADKSYPARSPCHYCRNNGNEGNIGNTGAGAEGGDSFRQRIRIRAGGKGGQTDTPINGTDIETETLNDTDREMLIGGIPADGREELLSLLEDFSS